MGFKERATKVFLWRIISVAITLVVMLLITGNVSEASTLTLILQTLLMFSHYTFELAWDKYHLRVDRLPDLSGTSTPLPVTTVSGESEC
jgi:uncharacterized membrane protein